MSTNIADASLNPGAHSTFIEYFNSLNLTSKQAEKVMSMIKQMKEKNESKAKKQIREINRRKKNRPY